MWFRTTPTHQVINLQGGVTGSWLRWTDFETDGRHITAGTFHRGATANGSWWWWTDFGIDGRRITVGTFPRDATATNETPIDFTDINTPTY